MAETEIYEDDVKLKDYQPMEHICKINPSITLNQLRWLAANKERYDLSHVIKRIGKKLYFNVPGLLSWIDKQNA